MCYWCHYLDNPLFWSTFSFCINSILPFVALFFFFSLSFSSQGLNGYPFHFPFAILLSSTDDILISVSYETVFVFWTEALKQFFTNQTERYINGGKALAFPNFINVTIFLMLTFLTCTYTLPPTLQFLCFLVQCGSVHYSLNINRALSLLKCPLVLGTTK